MSDSRQLDIKSTIASSAVENGRNDQADTACHIVVLTAPIAATRITKSESRSLSDEFVHQIASAAALWRDSKFVLKDLRQVVQNNNIGNVAVVYQRDVGTPLVVPDPLRVSFEPIELSEEDIHLRQLIDENAPPKGGQELGLRRSSYWRRMLVLAGLPSITILYLLLVGLIDLVPSGGRRFHLSDLIYPAFLAVVMFSGFIRYFLSPQWFLIPGGIIRRWSLFGMVYGGLRRHTPLETTLILRPFAVATRGFFHKPTQVTGWCAELWQEKMCYRKNVTYFEATSLLAAWQCPLPPPSLSQIAALM